MADDLAVTPGSGATMRTTDVGGKHLQNILAGEKVRVSDGDATLSLSASSQALPSIPGTATHATVYCDCATPASDFARYLEGNTAPTASAGKRLKDHEEIAVSSLSTFHAIIGSGTTLVLRIFYYHYA